MREIWRLLYHRYRNYIFVLSHDIDVDGNEEEGEFSINVYHEVTEDDPFLTISFINVNDWYFLKFKDNIKGVGLFLKVEL